jgi:hypothetical protein
MLPLLLVALTADPSPAPSATPLLKTIVTVKSSSICDEFANHTNAMIGMALQNDQALGTAILALQSEELGQSSMSRRSELMSLTHLADTIYKQYRAGLGEAGALRDLADKATDPDQKAALKATADALAGALYRQHLIQRDLDGFVAYLDAADMRSGWDDDDRRNTGYDANPYYWTPGGFAGSFSGPPRQGVAGDEDAADDVRMAQEASKDFQSRMPLVRTDEMTAAGRIEQAAEKC